MCADADATPSPRMTMIQALMKAFKAFKVAFLNTTLSSLGGASSANSTTPAANATPTPTPNKTT